jgi:hypothetical protein
VREFFPTKQEAERMRLEPEPSGMKGLEAPPEIQQMLAEVFEVKDIR